MNAWVSVLGGTMAYSLGLCLLAVKLYCLSLILLFETMSALTERRKAEPRKQLCTAGVCGGNGSCDRESCRACQGWQQFADLWRYSSWWHSDTGIALCVYVPALCDILIWVSHSVSVFMSLLYVTTFIYSYHPLSVFMYLLCVTFRYRCYTLCI